MYVCKGDRDIGGVAFIRHWSLETLVLMGEDNYQCFLVRKLPNPKKIGIYNFFPGNTNMKKDIVFLEKKIKISPFVYFYG